MMRSLWTAASGMAAQQFKIDLTSNNIANVNTAGFKKSRVEFQDLLYQRVRFAGSPITAGAQIPTGIEVGHGVRPVATQKIFTPGPVTQTDNPLDLMIEGAGFFRILLPDGREVYTRDGGFKTDSEGRIVTSDGFLLADDITIPEDALEISVSTDGLVLVQRADGSITEAGDIQLALFVNPAGLSSFGRNLYVATDASGAATAVPPGMDGAGLIAQGYIEMSNVDIVEEMVSMIISQRAYESNSRAIQASDDMLQTANNLRR